MARLPEVVYVIGVAQHTPPVARHDQTASIFLSIEEKKRLCDRLAADPSYGHSISVVLEHAGGEKYMSTSLPNQPSSAGPFVVKNNLKMGYTKLGFVDTVTYHLFLVTALYTAHPHTQLILKELDKWKWGYSLCTDYSKQNAAITYKAISHVGITRCAEYYDDGKTSLQHVAYSEEKLNQILAMIRYVFTVRTGMECYFAPSVRTLLDPLMIQSTGASKPGVFNLDSSIRQSRTPSHGHSPVSPLSSIFMAATSSMDIVPESVGVPASPQQQQQQQPQQQVPLAVVQDRLREMAKTTSNDLASFRSVQLPKGADQVEMLIKAKTYLDNYNKMTNDLYARDLPLEATQAVGDVRNFIRNFEADFKAKRNELPGFAADTEADRSAGLWVEEPVVYRDAIISALASHESLQNHRASEAKLQEERAARAALETELKRVKDEVETLTKAAATAPAAPATSKKRARPDEQVAQPVGIATPIYSTGASAVGHRIVSYTLPNLIPLQPSTCPSMEPEYVTRYRKGIALYHESKQPPPMKSVLFDTPDSRIPGNMY